MSKYFSFLLLILVSCGGSNEEKPPTVKVTLPDEIFGEVSETPITVTQVKTKKAGDSVTLRGTIMGRRQPFVDNRASFLLGDPNVIKSCNTNPDDNCKTPWDVCCEPSKTIMSATLNIQILDKSGKVYKTGLKGIHGLKELKEVIIEGVVDEKSTPGATIINVKKIQVIE